MQNTSDERLLISRSADTVALAEKHYCLKTLGFLSPYERSVIEQAIIVPHDIICCFFGGYDHAERTVFAAAPDFFENIREDIPIAVLEISGRDIASLSHRDYLGAILGLGIKREKIGDILVLEDRCIVFVLEDIAEYILSNLCKIGRVGIKVVMKKISDIEIPEPKFKEINGTVSSMRLDCIIALALNVSRNVASNLILGERVFINWKLENRTDYILTNDAMVSVRGFGRFKIKASDKFSRKNRQHITIEMYL